MFSQILYGSIAACDVELIINIIKRDNHIYVGTFMHVTLINDDIIQRLV